MKKYLIFSFLFLTFVMRNITDCPFQTEIKQSYYNYTGKNSKGLAHTKTVVNPFNSFRYFGFGGVSQSYGLYFILSIFNSEKEMRNTTEEKGFERGEVSPPQAAALSQYLQFVARELPETIALFDELFVAYLGSDLCTSQSENERSNTGFHFFKLRAFLQTLSVVAPKTLSVVEDPANGLQQKGGQQV